LASYEGSPVSVELPSWPPALDVDTLDYLMVRVAESFG
jgi:hypothetical protein